MDDIIIVAGLFGLFVMAGIAIYVDRRKSQASLRERIKNNWGKAPEREYTYEEFESITHYFAHHKGDKPVIDDITWNDLEMDDIFMLMNQTYSSVGEEYLYALLRKPLTSTEELEERDRLVCYLTEQEEERVNMQMVFAALGRTARISVSDYIERFTDLTTKSVLPDCLMALSILICIGIIFIQPPLGAIALILCVGNNIRSYYKTKSEIEPYMNCISYIMRVLKGADRLQKLELPGASEYLKKIGEKKRIFQKFRKNSFLVAAGNGMTGSLEDVVLDYVRMIFHIDILKFYSMLEEVKKHRSDIDDLIEQMGMLESAAAIGSFRAYLPFTCRPELLPERKAQISVENGYHPMINDPVANSIEEDRSVLITGSNASGKSTFLKTTALCTIFAQTIYACPATVYRACFFQVYSSMALRDDLMGKESYYIVEIKSLKRILNHVEDELPVLCFVDEVLRGTNTIERISASAQVLKSLCRRNILCFAATHDIELTHILENYYSNYHFQEEIRENDVLFNYKLMKGRAVSRNAIRLLGIIGYDEEIIRRAEKMAERFASSGEWRL